MLRLIGQFFRDAGKLGVASEIGAVILYVVALWEHAQDRTVTFYVFACVSVLLFWLGAGIAWNKQYSEAETLRRRASEVPRIKLKKFFCDNRDIKTFDAHGNLIDVVPILSLVARFTNEPEFSVESANAKDVIANIEIFNMDVEQNPAHVLTIDHGNWATNLESSRLAATQTNKDIIATNIRIRETVELDIAMRQTDEDDCYAVSNESGLKNGKLRLKGQSFLAKVRLGGTGLDNCVFEFRFENRGRWDYLQPLI